MAVHVVRGCLTPPGGVMTGNRYRNCSAARRPGTGSPVGVQRSPAHREVRKRRVSRNASTHPQAAPSADDEDIIRAVLPLTSRTMRNLHLLIWVAIDQDYLFCQADGCRGKPQSWPLPQWTLLQGWLARLAASEPAKVSISQAVNRLTSGRCPGSASQRNATYPSGRTT